MKLPWAALALLTLGVTFNEPNGRSSLLASCRRRTHPRVAGRSLLNLVRLGRIAAVVALALNAVPSCCSRHSQVSIPHWNIRGRCST